MTSPTPASIAALTNLRTSAHQLVAQLTAAIHASDDRAYTQAVALVHAHLNDLKTEKTNLTAAHA